jgi:hypothetical protein
MQLVVELPDASVNELRAIAAKNGITLTAALVQSLHNENFIGRELADGGRLLIEKRRWRWSNLRLHEVVYVPHGVAIKRRFWQPLT